MSLKICLLGMALVAGGFGEVPAKQTADLSARELYYTEKPVNDQLPSLSTAASGGADQSSHDPKKVTSETKRRTSVVWHTPKKTASGGHDSAPSQSPSDKVVNTSQQPDPASTAIPVVDHLGLRYSLLLVDKNTNESQPVDPDRVFHTGDCLAIELEPNRAGYMYVLQRLPTGNWDALFPSPQIQEESEVVHGRTKQRVPQNYCFELDEQRGEEHLYLILSRNPEQLYDLHDAVLKKDSTTGARAAAGASTKAMIADTNQFNKEATDAVVQLASRGFKITKLSAPETGERKYSVYVVPATLEKKDTVFADIQIKHQ